MALLMVCEIHGETHFLVRKDSGHRCGKCSSAAVQKRRHKIKEMAIAYKGGKCVRCGYNKCKASMAFHHTDPNEKNFSISYKGYTMGWEKVRVELDKCILVCANCHGEIHDELDTKNVI